MLSRSANAFANSKPGCRRWRRLNPRWAHWTRRSATMKADEVGGDVAVIGITQGRLSPPTPGVIQCFPVETWREEFSLAKQAGLDCIEWVYQLETEGRNPLGSDEGLAHIRAVIEKYGVKVSSVSADIYMKQRLIAEDGVVREDGIAHLRHLL